jgi:hypothetical protein
MASGTSDTPTKAFLVRVAVDQAYGGWNAPVDPASNRFVYLPIPEKISTPFHPNLERRYDEFMPPLNDFSIAFSRSLDNLNFPTALHKCPVHLDPDFKELTYGDDGGRRGSGMKSMVAGDLLVFYAGLKPVTPCTHKLIYGLVGLYVVDEVVEIQNVHRDRWHENAHTRKSRRGASDIVVRARSGVSGRMERCIPIGEWRDRAYRVRRDVLDAWGGLTVKDGYIQRSAVPPAFHQPQRFYDWFKAQGVALIDRNN